MIAETAGRADDDVGARGKLALLAARIHAADAGDDPPARIPIEPGQFALDLKREFAGRRHDQGKRRTGLPEPLGIIEEIFGDRQPVGDGLAGAGLGRHQEVAAGRFVREHGKLDGGQ